MDTRDKCAICHTPINPEDVVYITIRGEVVAVHDGDRWDSDTCHSIAYDIRRREYECQYRYLPV